MTTTRKRQCRAFAALVSLICMFTVLFGSAEPVFADSDYNDVAVKLQFVNDDESVTTLTDNDRKAVYDMCADGDIRAKQISHIALRLRMNGQFEEGQIEIRVPYYAFLNRTEPASDTLGVTFESYRNFAAQIDGMSVLQVDKTKPFDVNDPNAVVVLTNKKTNALQATINLNYQVNGMDIVDEFPYDFGVTITDTKTKEDLSPEHINATFKTGVDNVEAYKGLDDYAADGGCYYRWDSSLMTRYDMKSVLGISDEEAEGLDDAALERLCKERFTKEAEEYDFVSFYIKKDSIRANQRYVIYLEEMPGNGGEVVAVSHKYSDTRLTPLKKVTEGRFAGQWLDTDTKNTADRMVVLVKYPKDQTEPNESGVKRYKNKAKLTLAGVDGNDDYVTSDSTSATAKWNTISNVSIGDIWDVEKRGAADPSCAMPLLEKGKDVTFKYDLTGQGKTFKYAIPNDLDYMGEEYCLELVDDAMFLTGMGDDGNDFVQLGPTDFFFRTFTADLKHNYVVSVKLNNEPLESHHVKEADREPLEVWVMTAEKPGEWVLDQKLTHFSRENRHYCDENGNETFNVKHKDAYKLKFRYPKANGDVKLQSHVEGVLRGSGENVAKVMANVKDKDIRNVQLFNSDGVIGTDKAGNWLNPDSGANISASISDMKKALLEYDESQYTGHKYTGEETPKITMRKFADNKMTDTKPISGAAKMLDADNDSNGVTFTEEKKINVKYLLAAVNGGAASADDLETLADAGLIGDSKKIVFHELLPRGLAVKSVKEFKGEKDFTGHYTWDSYRSNAGYLGTYNDAQANITIETEDNYKGTLRQMATITLEYDEMPVVYAGKKSDAEQRFFAGAVIALELEADFADVTVEKAENNVAVQFINADGTADELEGENVHADDGSVFSAIKDRNGKNALTDLDNDNDTAKKTVVGASCYTDMTKAYTATQLTKKIKADDYDLVFKDFTQTYAGHNYTYKLHFFTNDGTARNVVIFDSIEQAWKDREYKGMPHWQGTLTGVDLTEAHDMGFDKIEVYVNTEKYYENSEIASDYDGRTGLTYDSLSGEGWQKVDPDTYKGWADVKTIAFALGKDTLFGTKEGMQSEVNLYLKMRAPEAVSPEQTKSEQILAYNQPAFYSEKSVGNNVWDADTTISNVVTIGIKGQEEKLPAITKKLSGEGIPLAFSDECEFDIRPVGDAPVPRSFKDGKWSEQIKSVKLTVGGSKLSAVSEDNGSLYFTEPSIDPENPNVYEYIISEKQGNAAPVSYSKEKYKVVYKVSDDRRDVQYDDDTELNVETAIYKITDAQGKSLETPVQVSSIVFENGYKAEPVKAKLPVVNKKIEGDDRPQDKTFTFTLTADSKTPVPKADTVSITGEGEAEFGEVEFTKAGTYEYIVYENKGTDGGYTYSDKVYSVKVTVVDDGGKLKVDETKIMSGKTPAEGSAPEFDKTEESIVFVNTYDAEATDKVSIPTVSKEYTGARRPADKKFSFTISGENGAPLPEKTTVAVTGIGTADFDSLVFTKAGTYIYKITEDDLSEDAVGYTKDESVYVYTVTVTDRDGKLYAQGKLTDGEGKSAEAAVFINKYEPLPTEYTFPVAVKKVEGNVPEGEEKTFAFVLNPVTEGAPMPEKNTASVKGSGNATAFGKLKFTEAGSYTYEVYEQELGDDCTGYTKDNSVYTLNVRVYNDDGQLRTEAKLTKQDKAADKAEFVNVYKPAKTEIELPMVNKTVEGNTNGNEDKTFTFTIKGEDGAPLPEKTQVSVTGSGTASTGKAVFDKAGTYKYTITEDEHNNAGYSRDAAVYEVTVNVADKGGRLEAAYVLTKDGTAAEQVSFVNRYEPAPAEAVFEVSKTVTGNAPEEGEEYTFVIKAADGAPVPENESVTITGEGSAVFGKVNYTETGVYTYTVSENAGSSENCTYDDRIMTVTDTVTDEDGVLTVSRKITSGDEEFDSITFVNDYEQDEETTPEEESEVNEESSSSVAESSEDKPESSSSRVIEQDTNSKATETDKTSRPDENDESRDKSPVEESSSKSIEESSSSVAESSESAGESSSSKDESSENVPESSIPEESSNAPASSSADSSDISSKPVPEKDQSSESKSSSSSRSSSSSSSKTEKTSTAVTTNTPNPSTGSKTLIGAQAALLAAALVVLKRKKNNSDDEDER